MGGLSHQALMTNIELYGTRVIPASANCWRNRVTRRGYHRLRLSLER